MGGLFGRHYFVLFVVKPGPKLGEHFAAVPRTFRHDSLLARPRAEAPEWLFEALGSGSWKVAGSAVSSVVEDFIEANYDVLTGAPVTR